MSIFHQICINSAPVSAASTYAKRGQKSQWLLQIKYYTWPLIDLFMELIHCIVFPKWMSLLKVSVHVILPVNILRFCIGLECLCKLSALRFSMKALSWNHKCESMLRSLFPFECVPNKPCCNFIGHRIRMDSVKTWRRMESNDLTE